MNEANELELQSIKAFAKRYGLTELTDAHIERMRELVPAVAGLSSRLVRPSRKEDAPAQRVQLT